MKKRVVGLSLLALVTGAYAQSSVTLYGRMDNGVVYRSGVPGGHEFGAQSGGWGESWWGMLGSEDIGDGSKVGFQLEGGLNTMTGGQQNGGIFGRHATVSIGNDKFGTFKLGNLGAGAITQDSWDLDPQLMLQYANATLDKGRTWEQTGNGFEYTSPNFSGLSFKGQYALTNQVGNWNGGGSASGGGSGPSNRGNGQGRSDGAKAMYTNSNLELLAIYDEIRDWNGKFDDVYVASRELIAGGTYQWGPAKLYVAWQHMMAPDANFNSVYVSGGTQGLNAAQQSDMTSRGITGAPTVVNHLWAGVDYMVNPALTLAAAVYHANANNGNGSANLFTLTGTYNLSKRTFLYTEGGYITNSKTSNVGLGNGYSDPYGPNSVQDSSHVSTSNGPGYGKSQVGVIAGIFHTF